jgi:homoserine kinase
MGRVPFLTRPVRVRAPATSANLGPGFDTLGLALALHDEVAARVTDRGIRVAVTGEGAGRLPTGEDHLVVATMMATFDRLGPRPAGLDLTCHNRIPHARGLGSSSAAIVAGILLARALVADGAARIDDAEALRLAAEFEGHPDNVAPCLLGGLTIAWTDEGGARAVRLALASGVHLMVYVPTRRGLTAEARAALPATVPHRDAAFNAARSALLVHALTTEPALLHAATEDRLHQGYRAPGMPETAELVARLRSAGVAAVVSGAGPSVLALLPEGDGDAARDAHRLIPDGWDGHSLGVAATGAGILIPEHAGADPVAAGLPS